MRTGIRVMLGREPGGILSESLGAVSIVFQSGISGSTPKWSNAADI